MSDLETDRKWLYSRLAGDSILMNQLAVDAEFSPSKPAIYDEVIPESRQQTSSSKYPAVVIQMVAEMDWSSQTIRRHQIRDFNVFAIVEGGSFPIAIAERLINVIDGRTESYNATIVTCARIGPFEMPSVEGGKNYRRSGARFRLYVTEPYDPTTIII